MHALAHALSLLASTSQVCGRPVTQAPAWCRAFSLLRVEIRQRQSLLALTCHVGTHLPCAVADAVPAADAHFDNLRDGLATILVLDVSNNRNAANGNGSIMGTGMAPAGHDEFMASMSEPQLQLQATTSRSSVPGGGLLLPQPVRFGKHHRHRGMCALVLRLCCLRVER